RNRLKTGQTIRGPWHLGRFSGAINLIALVWVAFISVVLCFPDDMRAGKAIVVLAALLGIFYLARERRRFPGPAFQISEVDERSPLADAEPLTDEAPGD
ncbi:MAG TPA: hypothetical protein VIS78_00830, partial [Blastocatellia bacterium]